MSRCAACTPRLAMRPFRVLSVLALVAASATCHLDRLVKSSGGGGGGGGPPPPGPPVTLAFTVQPRGTKPDSAIKPPVQVTARDSAGNTSTNYSGVIRVAIATDGSAGKNAKLVGDTVATAVSGVATFSGLSVDQPGSGYTLSAALATGPSMGTSAAFDVSTVPPPPPTTGDLTVSAVTTGSDLDPDGYTVTVDGGQSQALGVNASTTYSGLTATDHSVQLGGIASNCTVTNANPQTASVPAGATAQVTFDITCAALPPTTGDLKVTTSTTGSNLDPDGYTVSVDGGTGQPITINNSTGVTFTALTAGSHSVTLSGVAANCAVSGGATQTVNITANQTATLAFAVTCAATTGSISVTTNTGGSNLDPDGYTVAVDGGTGQAIGINTTITLTPIPTGSHTVTLSGVASNCTVSGGNSQTTTVASGQTATVTFSVTCAATTGSLTVTTTTSGSNLDPDGYTVAVDGGTGQAIGINTSFTFNGVATGSHTVTLSGVAGNCTVSGGNSQTTTVSSGQTASVTFSVTCAALTGSLTVTTATSGSNQPSGYTVTVDGGQSKNIAASGNVSYTGLAATSHSVQLNGVPSNCTVSEANPQSVSVPANGTGQATFTVTCTAPPNQPPVAAFTSSCSQLTCSFTSTSSDPDGSIAAYQWTFGDGGTATTQNPSHTYSAGGTYTVQLTVTDNRNATNSVTHSVTVTAPPPPNQPPVAAFTSSCSQLTCSFTSTSSDPDGSIAAYQWTFGDGGTATTQNPSHTYSAGGTYTVQLTVTDNQNATNSVTHSVTVTAPPPPNQPPVAAFTSSCSGLTCSFTSTSSDPDGSIAAYQWAFGDGATATTQNPSHTYSAGGTYTVQLTVTDNQNATNSVTHSVTVTAPPPPNQPPVAAFTSSCNGLTCNFTSTSSDPDGSISAYQWTFGDGGTATTQNPSHTYSAGGTFTVQLTVTDNQNATNSVTHSVTVTAPPPPNQPPVAAFTSSCNGLTCSFTSTSSDPDGSISAYQWDFGDGGSATTQNPSHTYSAGGTYTVRLTVTDNQNATNSVTHSVTVTAPPPPNQPPVVTAGGNQSVLVGALFTLSGASFSDPNHNGPWTITIDWGDGSSTQSTTSSEGSIGGSHSYVTVLPATYTVTITVTDAGGLSGSASKTVNVTTL
jgi:PKD repeat protein